MKWNLRHMYNMLNIMYKGRNIVFMFALFQNSANLHNMSFIYFMLWEVKYHSTPVSQK